MNYKAVIFDLDGTLLDTIEDLMDTMNFVMAEIGAPAHGIEDAKLCVGDGLRNYVLRCLPDDKRADEPLVAACCQRFKQKYATGWQVKTHAYEGVAEMLTALAGRDMPMAILTNKPDEFAQVIVSRLLGRWNFNAVRGVGADGVKKPDPAGAIDIAASIGVAPAECLYLGDTNTDMRTAIAAGMFPVGATWGYRLRSELIASGAKSIIDKPVELLALLNGR